MQPLVHQIDLISNAVKELTASDRTTLLSACGTGKTYISYKIMETMGSKTILLMFPSLALLEQTHNEYLKFNTFTNYNPIFVCSNKGIGSDDIKLEDLSVTSTTNIDNIKAYMDLDIDTKVIFSTYHSSDLLVEAGIEFDFALYDEAHRVAQVQDGIFASTLLDSNIKIKKRLFVTATPKHYKLNNDTPVFSMDDQDYFGKVSSDYSFRQAIDDGVIVDYKIIVGVITNEDLLNTIGGASYNDQSAQQLKHLAKEIALMKAIKKVNAKKVIGFAERINKSKQYANGLQSLMPKYNAQHIDSTQGAINRKAIIEKFSLNELEIIMNANLLSEGVDIPAVDMVAFMEKTNSIVNVIQRLGRALRVDRQNPNKVGYIFIPIFIDMEKENLTKEDLNKSVEWKNVYEIINTVKESDENLKNIIESVSINPTSQSENELSEVIQVENFSGEILHNSINVSILNGLKNEFMSTFNKIEKYISLNGKIPTRSSKDKTVKQMGVAIHRYRSMYRKGTLGKVKTELLRKIGISFLSLEEKFEKCLDALVSYEKEHGIYPVGAGVIYNECDLSNFLSVTRRNIVTNNISKDRLLKLENADFKKSGVDMRFLKMINLSYKYIKEHGYVPIKGTIIDNENLFTWICNQRSNIKAGIGNKKQYGKLWKYLVDYRYTKDSILWIEQLNKIKSNKSSQVLTQWKFNNRNKVKAGKLPEWKIKMLKEAGII